MSDLHLRAVTRTQGNNQALKDGTVVPEGFRFDFEEVPVLVQAFRRMVRDLEFDVCEMALTTYLVAKAHGVPFTAVPAFLVRGFHHAAITVDTRHGITSPKDLEGKRVGVSRGYTVTTGVWARSILAVGVRRRPGLDHLGALRRRARGRVPAAGQRGVDPARAGARRDAGQR